MKKLSTLLLIAAVAAGIDANSAEVTRIAAGDHTMLLTKDGKIYVSGKNDAGQLGDGHYFDSEISDNHYNATTFKPVEKDGVKFRSVPPLSTTLMPSPPTALSMPGVRMPTDNWDWSA